MHRLPRVSLILGVGLLAIFLFFKSNTATLESNQRVESTESPHVRVIEQHEVIYEFPKGRPIGLFALAHGCTHSAGDFWPRSEACLHCLGLPEEMAIRKIVVQRGHVAVAISSTDREEKCWDHEVNGSDLVAIPKILNKLHKDLDLGKLPIYAFGASSGGFLALLLPQTQLKLKAICCQIMGASPSLLHLPEGQKFPPTVFYHMTKDIITNRRVAADIAYLGEQGVPTAEVAISPHPVTPEFLSRRSHALKHTDAVAVVEALRQGGFLDDAGLLKKDPRGNGDEWRPVVAAVLNKDVSLEPDTSALPEMLNVAWAKHEIDSLHMNKVIEWMESGGTKALEV